MTPTGRPRDAIAYETRPQYRRSVLRPAVQYARATDGTAIAYSIIGDGPCTAVFVSPLIAQLEIAWEEPAFEHFVTRLAVGMRVVLFDRRGSGLSDQSSSPADLQLPRLASDVEAVLDAAGADRAVVIGASLGGTTAVQFVHDHPTRSNALALIATSARLTTAPGYSAGIDPSDIDSWIDEAVARWGTGGSVEAEGPSMAGNIRYRDWAARLERHTSSPRGVATTLRAAFGYDVRPLLPRIAVPTLVIHRHDDPGTPAEHARYLADHIPDAAYVGLPGQEHTYFLGDHDAVLAALRNFMDDRVTNGAIKTAVRRAERRSSHGIGWEALTPAEREVAILVAQGLTNAEVADRLGMSRYTVDGRLRRVFNKLDVTTRVALAAEYSRAVK
jgi:pimeloyl-ACP methyl ester carboxylesterase/DNA-binding CsgD family transcriptional regulator